MQYDLVSVDDHIIEPPHVWTDRLPAKHREAGPHVVEADDREYWVYEGRRGQTMGLNAVAGKERKEYSMDPVRYADMIPGCYDPVQRAKDLLADGIRGERVLSDVPTLRRRHVPQVRRQGAGRPLRAARTTTG